MEYNDDMTVEEAAKAMKAKEARKVKKPKKKGEEKKKGWKAKVMDVLTDIIPVAKKAEKATKKRTGGKTMREKHFPK